MGDEELLLPEGARLIHIGPPKTGTTAIQQAMHNARPALAHHGVHYAGPTLRPSAAGRELVVEAPRHPGHPLEKWRELVREVASAGDVRVCISDEGLAAADDDEAARIVTDLGGRRAHVVASVRRLDKILPSQWQQRIRRRPGTPTYDEWLKIVLSAESDDKHWQHFWSHHDLSGALRRWVAAADPERVTMIVADESDRTFLPTTFERLLGLPAGFLASATQDFNRSLTHNEASLVLSLNQLADEKGWTTAEFQELIRPVSTSLRSRPPGSHDARITTPAWALDRIRELTEDRYDAVVSSDVRVIGTPEALRWTPPSEEQPVEAAPDAIATRQASAALGAVIEVLLDRNRASQRKVDDADERLANAKATNAELRRRLAGGPDGTAGAEDRRPVSEVSGRELLGTAARRLRRRVLRRGS